MFYRWRPAKVFRYPSPLLLPLKSAPIQAEKQFNARLSYGSLSVLFLIAFRLGVGHEELNSYQRSRRLLLLLFHLLLLFSFPPFFIFCKRSKEKVFVFSWKLPIYSHFTLVPHALPQQIMPQVADSPRTGPEFEYLFDDALKAFNLPPIIYISELFH